MCSGIRSLGTKVQIRVCPDVVIKFRERIARCHYVVLMLKFFYSVHFLSLTEITGIFQVHIYPKLIHHYTTITFENHIKTSSLYQIRLNHITSIKVSTIKIQLYVALVKSVLGTELGNYKKEREALTEKKFTCYILARKEISLSVLR